MEDRKLKILSAIVEQYIISGEPVGSKSLLAQLDINVSPATIRNEMAALEQLGYLEQPHTSAGRIPSFNGYRLYVDELMKKNTISDEEKTMIDDLFIVDDLTADGIVQSATTALAEITKCAIVAANSTPKFSVISRVEVIPTGKRVYVVLMITSSGNIKNKACRLEFDLTEEQLSFFSNFVSENLEGLSVDTISEDMMENLATAMGTYMMTLSPLIEGICEMSKDLVAKKLEIKGETNLLYCNDFDSKEIISFLQKKMSFQLCLTKVLVSFTLSFQKRATILL